jgi:hypothetical protein
MSMSMKPFLLRGGTDPPARNGARQAPLSPSVPDGEESGGKGREQAVIQVMIRIPQSSLATCSASYDLP